jgi:hypothetical protein
MQVFLPYPSFAQSIKVLDYRRCGKQRLEAKQLVESIIKLERGEPVKGWANHPARKMFMGYLDALKLYYNICIVSWVKRGYKNTMPLYDLPDTEIEMPHWLGDPAFHASHRSNLLRKDPVYYGQFGWTEPHDLPYVWPGGADTLQV